MYARRHAHALALLLGLLAPAAARAQVEAVCASGAEREVLALVNAERAALGRPPLALDVRLTAAARRHAEDMRDGCFLSHTGSDGSSPFERMAEAAYPDGIGEVAAAGSFPYPPGQVVDSWMESSGHRAILVDLQARHLGMGRADRPAGCLLEFQGQGFWAGASGPARRETAPTRNSSTRPAARSPAARRSACRSRRRPPAPRWPRCCSRRCARGGFRSGARAPRLAP